LIFFFLAGDFNPPVATRLRPDDLGTVGRCRLPMRSPESRPTQKQVLLRVFCGGFLLFEARSAVVASGGLCRLSTMAHPGHHPPSARNSPSDAGEESCSRVQWVRIRRSPVWANDGGRPSREVVDTAPWRGLQRRSSHLLGFLRFPVRGRVYEHSPLCSKSFRGFSGPGPPPPPPPRPPPPGLCLCVGSCVLVFYFFFLFFCPPPPPPPPPPPTPPPHPPRPPPRPHPTPPTPPPPLDPKPPLKRLKLPSRAFLSLIPGVPCAKTAPNRFRPLERNLGRPSCPLSSCGGNMERPALVRACGQEGRNPAVPVPSSPCRSTGSNERWPGGLYLVN